MGAGLMREAKCVILAHLQNSRLLEIAWDTRYGNRSKCQDPRLLSLP